MIGFARALYLQPQLLILDEATAGYGQAKRTVCIALVTKFEN